MSNLLKSKTFKVGGLVVALAMMVGVASVATAQTTTTTTTTVTAPAYNYSGVMKVGSKGPGVSTLQAALNSVQTMQVVVDGSFGPATKAAVMAFQASHNLVADGIVGPATGAKLAAATVGTITVPGGFPAGCTSASGFSTTTGMPCNSGTSLPAGCTSTAGYSPTTGVKCSTGGSTTGGPLTGGAGDITVDGKSTYASEDVSAGEENVKVAAFEIEADDESDVDITSIKVEFKQVDTDSSEKLDDYAESVSVWMGSTKVGEADVEDFTENSDVYSKSISLDGAVIDAGETEDFVIAVTALNNLDSGDIDDDDWVVGVSSVRFTDGEGVSTTDSLTLAFPAAAGTPTVTIDNEVEQTFDFEDLSTSGDLEAKITEHADSPEASSVEVDDTSDTNDVLLLAANFKATGSDMTVDTLSFDITPTGANANEIVSEYKLLVDGEEIDSISATSIATTVTAQIQFTDLEDEFMVEEDDTVKIELVADVKDINGAFTTGDSIVASLTSTNFNATNTSIDDANGDSVANGDRTGAVTGETITFYTDGIAVALDSVDADAFTVDGVNNDRVELSITFDVTAFGSDVYIPSLITVASAGTGSTGTAPTAAQGAGLHLQSSDAQLTTAKGSAILTSTADETAYTPTGTDATDNAYTSLFKVNEGSTETFTAKVNVSNAVATAGDLDDAQVRSILTGLTFSPTNVIVTATTYVYTSNLQNDYKTPYATIAD